MKVSLIVIALEIIKFLSVYYFFGMAAVLIIMLFNDFTEAACYGMDILQKYSEGNIPMIIENFKNRILSEIPFGEVLNKMFEDSMLEDSGSYFELFSNLIKGKLPFDTLSDCLFYSVVNVITANFIIYLFCRINIILSRMLSGAAFKVGLFISMGIFGIAGFSISANIMTLVRFYSGDYSVIAYTVLAAVCFILHALCLGCVWSKNQVRSAAKFLATEVGWGIVNSLLIWILCTLLSGLYRYEQMYAFFIAFLVFSGALAFEKEVSVRLR